MIMLQTDLQKWEISGKSSFTHFTWTSLFGSHWFEFTCLEIVSVNNGN